jgi:hypothetical protein
MANKISIMIKMGLLFWYYQIQLSYTYHSVYTTSLLQWYTVTVTSNTQLLLIQYQASWLHDPLSYILCTTVHVHGHEYKTHSTSFNLAFVIP